MSQTKLSDVEQLGRMRDAHHQHGQAAHTLGNDLASTLGGLQGCTNWGGAGFDEATQFFQHFITHAHTFGAASTQLGEHVGTYYDGFKKAESQMTPE